MAFMLCFSFELDWNHLTGTIPSVLGNLSRLRLLYLSKCRFNFTRSASITNLKIKQQNGTYSYDFSYCILRILIYWFKWGMICQDQFHRSSLLFQILTFLLVSWIWQCLLWNCYLLWILTKDSYFVNISSVRWKW